MFTPPGAPAYLHLDKCAKCGEWTPEEEKLVVEKLKAMIMQSQQQVGGCNCTGQR